MGYFVKNDKNTSFIKSLSNPTAPLTPQSFTNLNFSEFFPEFYELIPARVLYSDQSNSHGGIQAEKIVGLDAKDEPITAYPLNIYIRKTPLVGDMVLLFEYPSDIGEENEKSHKDFPIKTNYYYIDSINLDNKPTFAKNLIPISNDIIFQGRYGQSIRFTSTIDQSSKEYIGLYKSPEFVGTVSELSYPTDGANVTNKETLRNLERKKNTWIYGNTEGKPLIVISNGRQLSEENIKSNKRPEDSIEDINFDDSSVYLTSDSIIPLQITPILYSIYLENQQFINMNHTGMKFTGKQIINVSDTLISKARKNYFVFSEGYTYINSLNSIVLTTLKDIVLEHSSLRSKILLGGKEAKHPIAKADELIKILNNLLDLLTHHFDHKQTVYVKQQIDTIKQDLHLISTKSVLTIT